MFIKASVCKQPLSSKAAVLSLNMELLAHLTCVIALGQRGGSQPFRQLVLSTLAVLELWGLSSQAMPCRRLPLQAVEAEDESPRRGRCPELLPFPDISRHPPADDEWWLFLEPGRQRTLVFCLCRMPRKSTGARWCVSPPNSPPSHHGDGQLRGLPPTACWETH